MFWNDPTPELDLKPGDRVQLPDGGRATVATVDEDEGEFTVEGWHEVYAISEALPAVEL